MKYSIMVTISNDWVSLNNFYNLAMEQSASYQEKPVKNLSSQFNIKVDDFCYKTRIVVNK